MKRLFIVLFALSVAAEHGLSQQSSASPGVFGRHGRWSAGVEGGGNMWINDFDTQDITAGGNLFVRYAVTPSISLGIMAGYDGLHSKNEKVNLTDAALRHSFIRSNGFSADAAFWTYFAPGKTVSPYFYAGVGFFLYKRTVEKGTPWEADEMYSSIHVPIGFGLEFALSRMAAVSAEVGVRLLDNKTDNFTRGQEDAFGTDSYPTARVGLSLYLGDSADSDEDAARPTDGEGR